jgi:hypothetical protein
MSGPTVGDLVRRASLDRLHDALQDRRAVGDVAGRDVLAARWRAAIDAGAGWRQGIYALSHDAGPRS